jgi:TRAP-type C4-dicarboxylate transport system substrate-binding protein
MLFSDYDHVWRAWDAGMGRIITSRYEKGGMHFISLTFSGYVGVGSNAKAISLPEDLKGQKIRSFAKTISEFIERGGGAPVYMASGEIYLALQRGTLDGYLTSWTSVTGRNLDEVTKYWTAANFGVGGMPVAINMDVWKKLPQDVQTVMMDSAKEAFREWMTSLTNEGDEKALAEMAKKGVKVIRPTSEQEAVWTQFAKPIYDEFAKQAGPDGVKILEVAEKTRK